MLWTRDWREQTLDELKKGDASFDLVVIGGGITGAGIYREACARGLHVLLVEQRDFSWGTSSRSSKMVHGGLRYLGKGQFGLARDSVTERQKLMEQLHGLVDPLPFLMGHYKGQFPGPWVFDKLLAIYDFFAGAHYRLFIKEQVKDFWAPGIKSHKLIGTTRFMDAVTDDARLVMRVLAEGNDAGGRALNYVKANGLMRCGSQDEADGRVVGVYLSDEQGGAEFQVQASAVVNATGAWTDELRQMLGKQKQIRPLRGSHLVIPFWRLPVSFSVSFFHPRDKRPVFVFPWEGQTVVGTTDLDHHDGMADEASIHRAELDYLLEAVNTQFSDSHVETNDIVSTWSGVRPVVVEETDDETVDVSGVGSLKDKSTRSNEQSVDSNTETKPSDVKREHMIWDDHGCISIAGGKLTTFRLLALEVLRSTLPYLSNVLSEASLQAPTDFRATNLANTGIDRPKVSNATAQRLLGRYGAYANNILELVKPKELQFIGTSETILEELLWACEYESVVHLDDLLLRRVRIGMLYPKGAKELIQPFSEQLRNALEWTRQQWDEEWDRYELIIERHYSLPACDGVRDNATKAHKGESHD